jgi:acyl carrier protein
MTERLEENTKLKEQILSKLKKRLGIHLELPENQITKDMRFEQDFDMDSLARYELCFYVEDELKISIKDEVVMELNTLGDYIEYILKNNCLRR